MLGLGVRTLWGASAIAVFSQWTWPGLCAYTLGSYLLRTHLPRLWGYQPMTTIDAAFLTSPFPDPMYLISIGLLSKTDTRTFRKDLETRVFPYVKRPKQYPTTLLGKNFWAEDSHFRLEDHIVTVNTPITTLDQLASFAGEVAIQSFPAKTPLWCAYLIEDFQDGSALVVRHHHCYQDGIGLVNTLVHNADKDCSRSFYSQSQPNALQRFLLNPVAMMLIPYGLMLRRKSQPDRNPITRPVTHTGEKSFGITTPLPLSLHLQRAKSLNVSFNDYVTAVVLRTLSGYLEQEHRCQHHSFTVGVAKAMRSHPSDGSPLPPGNDVAYPVLPMPPVTSPTLIHDISRLMKRVTSSKLLLQASNLTLRAFPLLPAHITHDFIKKMNARVTAAITNVPGSKERVSYGGTVLKSLYISPISGIPVTVAVISYADQFTAMWSADKAVVRDTSVFARLFETEINKDMQKSK